MGVLTKQEHDGSTGIVGVLSWYEGRHHEPQQSGEDSHHCKGSNSSKEDCELVRYSHFNPCRSLDPGFYFYLVVPHGKNGDNEESFVAKLRYLEGDWRLN